MKASVQSRQEPRWVSNGVIIAAMLLSIYIFSIVKARYCSTPFGHGKSDDQLLKQMNSNIRMETDDDPVPTTKMPGEEDEDNSSAPKVGNRSGGRCQAPAATPAWRGRRT